MSTLYSPERIQKFVNQHLELLGPLIIEEKRFKRELAATRAKAGRLASEHEKASCAVETEAAEIRHLIECYKTACEDGKAVIE